MFYPECLIKDDYCAIPPAVFTYTAETTWFACFSLSDTSLLQLLFCWSVLLVLALGANRTTKQGDMLLFFACHTNDLSDVVFFLRVTNGLVF